MQQILQSDVPIPAAVSPPLASHRPRYLGWASILMIAALVWANTALGFSPNGPVEDNLIQQLIVYGVFCFCWFSLVGLRLSNAVFVLVALHPSVLLEGYGYLFFSFEKQFQLNGILKDEGSIQRTQGKQITSTE
jgi:hypothetical protein